VTVIALVILATVLIVGGKRHFVKLNTAGLQQYDCKTPVKVTLSVNRASPDPFIVCIGQQISWYADSTNFTVSFGSDKPFNDSNGNPTGTFNDQSPGTARSFVCFPGVIDCYEYYKYTATVGSTTLPDPHGIIMK